MISENKKYYLQSIILDDDCLIFSLKSDFHIKKYLHSFMYYLVNIN